MHEAERERKREKRGRDHVVGFSGFNEAED